MQRKSLAAVIAMGVVAAIAIPTIAFGNARNNIGNQNFFQAAQTPYVMRLLGSNESPQGDPDGTGIASVTIDVIDPSLPSGGEVCWDLSYSGIAQPTLAHIHTGAAGTNGPILVPFVPFTNLGPISATGCTSTSGAVAQQIVDNPAGYYVNVHNGDYPGGALRGQLVLGDPPAGEAHMLPAPLRAYDSRAVGPKIAAGDTRTISLANGVDGQGANVVAVPPGATAAIVTLTVTETVAGGFLTMYSAATTQPATSSINWFANNQTFAVSTQVAVDAAGQVKISAGSSSTHFIIDVTGYLF